MLWNIPIESMPWRYSADWNEWFPAAYAERDLDYVTIDPQIDLDTAPGVANFLNPAATNLYKAAQTGEIARLFGQGRVRKGDVFFFHDLWHPGLTSLLYLRDAGFAPGEIKIAGILHAGTYDRFDFLAQRGMAVWGKGVETGWLRGVDMVIVATLFHAKMLARTRRWIYQKIVVVPLPFRCGSVRPVNSWPRRDLVVFPHRLAPEKNPGLATKLFQDAVAGARSSLARFTYVRTQDTSTSKDDYYQTLCQAKVAISCAKQETYGLAMLEAATRGCVPLVPDRLAYQELYPRRYRYRTQREAVVKLRDFARHYDDEILNPDYNRMLTSFADKAETALPIIVTEIRRLAEDCST